MSNEFKDEAGFLSLLAGLVTFAATANPSQQQQIFGDGFLKFDREKAARTGKEMGDAAEQGDKRRYLEHFKQLPQYLRKGAGRVAKSVKNGSATVGQYTQALNRARKGAAFSLKRASIETIHKELSKNKLTYTGKHVRFKTVRGKSFKFDKGRPFAAAKKAIGGGFYMQTYFPLQLNEISENVYNILKSNSKPRKKPMKQGRGSGDRKPV